MNGLQSQFPQLKATVYGNRLVYLDSAATTLKPQSVIDAVSQYYSNNVSNAGRSGHFFSFQNEQTIEKVRERAKSFFSIPETHDLVFTKHATESLNLAAHIVSYEKDIDAVLVATSAHHANFLPWQRLAIKRRIPFKLISLLPSLTLDLTKLETLLSKTKHAIVAVATVSNVTGVAENINAISDLCQKYRAELVIDGAQSVGHHKLNLSSWKFSYFAASSHKMYGPEGIGLLVLPKQKTERAEPLLIGGGIVNKVSEKESSYISTVQKFEAGTHDTAGIVGFDAALSFISDNTYDKIEKEEGAFMSYFWEKLSKSNLPIRVISPEGSLHAIVSFIAKPHAHDIGDFLDRHGIAVRVGQHCAQPLHDSLGIPASVRLSFGIYNSTEDIDYFFTILAQCLKKYS